MDSGLTRRQVVQAGLAAGAVALSSDPLVQIANAAKAPPPLGHLSDIDHVIILIQENRSFDHYFGTYSGVEGYGSASKSVLEQEGYEAEGFEGKLLPFHLNTGGVAQCFPDITHSWVPQHKAWDEGAMDNILRTHIQSDGEADGVATMGYYEKTDIPYYRALANAFTLCDHYHCSVLGPTDPNRLYSMSATVDPDGENGGPLVATIEKQASNEKGRFTWQTMPEALTAAGISWRIYNGEILGLEDNELLLFKNYETNAELKHLAFDGLWPRDFKKDLKEGLPQVTWINTSANETEHPGNSSAKAGEKVVAELLKLLTHHKKTWEKTALFITWDENGGFFDHVAPPVAPPGTPGEYLTAPDITGASGGIQGPIGLGFRVPTLVVSPYSRGGLVSKDTFDHTSMLRFIETRWGVEVPNLSEWRRSVTGDMTSAFNFAAPPIFKKPKELPKVAITPSEEKCTAVEPVKPPPNSYPVQESGTRGTPSGIV